MVAIPKCLRPLCLLFLLLLFIVSLLSFNVSISTSITVILLLASNASILHDWEAFYSISLFLICILINANITDIKLTLFFSFFYEFLFFSFFELLRSSFFSFAFHSISFSLLSLVLSLSLSNLVSSIPFPISGLDEAFLTHLTSFPLVTSYTYFIATALEPYQYKISNTKIGN
ncbi:hypothetical protein PUN28_001837 [Cardiocondyla obscurior]|uniref:NADH dehydrogenase subunit 6 n=1 Tax=Cardiocondyla obscurior TaxID=286306 RepID=A0AAW2GRC7_9HYME